MAESSVKMTSRDPGWSQKISRLRRDLQDYIRQEYFNLV
jgi:hypothetical protein